MGERLVLRRIGINLAVLLAYAGVAVRTTWPLAARLNTHLLAGSWDNLVHYWNGWWAQQALTTGQSPFYTPYLFHPTGSSLVYHNFAWLNIAAWLALKSWVGELGAHNLSLLVNLALCGFAAFLLIRDVTGDGLAAFLAGLIYQCWPFRLSQLGHPNLISTQWIPMSLLFLIRALRGGRWRDGALAGVFLALTGYTRWQQLVPAAIVGSIYLVCTLPDRWTSRRRSWQALLLAGGVAAVALAPPAMLLLNAQRTTPVDLLMEEEEATKQTDLLAYLTPSASHPVLGSLTRPAYERYYADYSGGSFASYIGVIALALALLGARKGRGNALPWAVMAFVLLLLALGPVLRLGGQLYPAVPMPYRLAARLFVVRLLRFPARYNMFLALPVAVLAAHGATQVLALARRRGRRTAVFLSCLLGAAILFEYWSAPIPLERPRISPFYVQLAAEPGDFAVLNLPIGPQKSKLYMFAQVTHHHPILQGRHTSRPSQGTYAYLDSHPWLRVLRQYSEMDPGLADVSRQLASLAADGVGYIILHKNQVGADRLAHWRRYLLIDPRFEDEEIVAYATSPLAGRDFALAEELAPGIGVIRVITSTDCLNPGRVLEVDVGWGTTAALERDLGVELGLVSSKNGISQAKVFPVSPTWPTGEWPVNAVAWGYYTLRVRPSLPSGTYTVTLALVDPATGAIQGQPSVVGQVIVSSSPCTFDVPPATVGFDAGTVGVNGLFGDDLRLLGYQLDHNGDRLSLALDWRSERRMETDYKIFVHVFDPATGVPVAQDDAMPHRWAYPTTFWGPGEVVEDVIPISLKGVPAGAYGIAVGVYDPATMERLPVVDGAGRPRADDRLVLPGETILVEEHGP
jgi:hypothetical protein